MNNPKKQRNIQILILFVLLGTILFSIIILNDYREPKLNDILSEIPKILLISFLIGGTMGFFLSILVINPKFYKPTKWKVILTIILFWILPYYSLTSDRMCPTSFFTETFSGINHFIKLRFQKYLICIIQPETILKFILPLLAHIIFSYALSCLLIFFYNKINKKELFKPTQTKLITFLISLIVWIFLPVIPVWNQRIGVHLNINNPMYKLSFISFSQIMNTTITTWIVISIIIEIFLLYTISCLIVSSIKKFTSP